MYLAGTDFPIQRLRSFERFPGRTAPADFINHYPLVPGTWGYGLIDKYFYLTDLKASLAQSRPSFRPRASSHAGGACGFSRPRPRLN